MKERRAPTRRSGWGCSAAVEGQEPRGLHPRPSRHDGDRRQHRTRSVDPVGLLERRHGRCHHEGGGLSLEEAQALIAQYRVEGEDFLQNRYHSGGPGDCGYGKADNCVGFDTYFMNKFTSFQQYAVGNGIDQAASIARATGKKTTKTPTVYSVASGPGSGSAGHVMVILGIEGDQAIIGEAACGTNHRGTRAYTRSVASITDSDWTFVDVSDLMLPEPKSA